MSELASESVYSARAKRPTERSEGERERSGDGGGVGGCRAAAGAPSARGSVLQRQGAVVVLALVVAGAWVALPFGSVDNLRDVALQSSSSP